MANILLAVDPNESRRRSFLDGAVARLAPLEGLDLGRLHIGDVGIIWSASPRAPIDVYEAAGSASVRWGIAIGDDGKEVSARQLADFGDPITPYDGFHALVRTDGSRLELSADILGLFRLYYANPGSGGVLLAGTCPSLFPLHPDFRPQLDVGALVGPLLLHFPFDQRTPWRDLKHTKLGHVLTRRRNGAVHERSIYTIPALGNHLSGEAVEHAEALQATWERALLQQLGGADSAGLLLSGGRDSRELAGFLHRNGIPTVALTLGDSRDIEARCASAVASHLGMPHRVRPVGEDNHPWCARQQVRWEHLSTGFGTMHMWDAIPWVRELPDRLVTGYLRGFGENKIHSGIFDSFLAWQNRRGLPAATIRGLLRAPDAGKIVEARLDELRATYMGGGPDPDTQRHRFIMGLRGRFHSGAIPWRLSFGSWPVVPILNRDFLALLSRLPEASRAGRRAQNWSLENLDPLLTRIPIERNDGTMDPIRITPVSWAQRRAKKWGSRLRVVIRRGWGEWDPRYIHRLYGFDMPGWQAVRREAEPHRQRLEQIFHTDTLHTLWPPPGTRTGLDPLETAYSRKLLVGLALWLSEHDV